ncbi:MAG: sigma-70 family RNA polymerase sigma factor [Cyclobacteriaceae bacterium]
MNAANPYTITDSVGDPSLWASFKAGDAQAFEIIYEQYIGLLTNYGLRIEPDRERVKDAIHDLFVDLWNHRLTLSHTDSIQYYLMKAFRRNLIKKIRADQNKQGGDITQLNTNLLFEFSHELTLMKAELAQENMDRLQHELEKLSSRQKEVLFLRFYSGFAPEEIAQILEINAQSVYNLIHRGLTSLRENMKYTAISTIALLLRSLPDIS